MIQPFRWVFWFTFYILWSWSAYAQENLGFKVWVDGQVSKREIKKEVLRDSLSIRSYIDKEVQAAFESGFLESSVDSFWIRKQKDGVWEASIWLHQGPKYKWASFKRGNVPEFLVQKYRFYQKFNSGAPFSLYEIKRLQKDLLNYAEQHGQPFARLSIDSLSLDVQSKGVLRFEGGPVYYFDTIVVAGTAKLKQSFLSKFLKIIPGEPFNQLKIEEAMRLLQSLPYVKVTQATYVVFRNKRAYPYFFIDHQKSNQADGIIGFLPGQNTQNQGVINNQVKSNPILITGEVNLLLRNLFNSGKTFQGDWKQFKQGSPTLNLHYQHPIFLGLPLGLSLDLNLLKDDTNFITVNRKLAIDFPVNGYFTTSFFTGLQSTSLISTNKYKNSTTLPAQNASSYNYYGLSFVYNHYDQPLYPRSGFKLQGNFSVGTKVIQKNSSINDALYANVILNSTQTKGSLLADQYWRLGKRTTLYQKMSGEWVQSSSLFLNELNRLGGFKTLRGFNENIFFTNQHAVHTLELRQYTDETAYVMLFYDQAWYQTAVSGIFQEEAPFGFGAGATFNTPAGMFYLVYALGKSEALNQSLVFNQSKIHFALVSRF